MSWERATVLHNSDNAFVPHTGEHQPKEVQMARAGYAEVL
jgi:hypothetical protein